MSRRLAALAVTLAAGGPIAHAQPAAQPVDDPDDHIAVGGSFGGRIFSAYSVLGYIDSAPQHPMLQSTIELTARVSRRFIEPWLFPEFELALSPTSTNAVSGAPSVGVVWIEPRIDIRFDVWRGHRISPFVLAGAGAPIALSSARKTFNTGIVGDGFFGAGARLDTGKGFALRFDARFALVPGVSPATGDAKLAYEGDVVLGFELAIGARHTESSREDDDVASAKPGDRDGDGIPDDVDKCPDRPEDKDGYQDADGCPDIDDDLDGVLDIADKCPKEPETYNGYEDEDGCPDTVPADVQAIIGTVEGLLYADAETAVRDSARPSLKKIAKVLLAHPSIKIVLVGHTDDREAKALAPPAGDGEAPDLDSIAAQLGHARAEAVKQALVEEKIGAGRIVIESEGAGEPVSDNNTPRGRLANRRVGLKLLIPRGHEPRK